MVYFGQLKQKQKSRKYSFRIISKLFSQWEPGFESKNSQAINLVRFDADWGSIPWLFVLEI